MKYIIIISILLFSFCSIKTTRNDFFEYLTSIPIDSNYPPPSSDVLIFYPIRFNNQTHLIGTTLIYLNYFIYAKQYKTKSSLKEFLFKLDKKILIPDLDTMNLGRFSHTDMFNLDSLKLNEEKSESEILKYCKKQKDSDFYNFIGEGLNNKQEFYYLYTLYKNNWIIYPPGYSGFYTLKKFKPEANAK